MSHSIQKSSSFLRLVGRQSNMHDEEMACTELEEMTGLTKLSQQDFRPSSSSSLPNPSNFLKLLFGGGGIYIAFLHYGSLQEGVFEYKSADGAVFREAWFLQALEAFVNVVVAMAGLLITGATKNLPQILFLLSGATQVSAKAFTTLALVHGVSFPVVSLAKSGKIVPVMVGSLFFGGATYSIREYVSALAIIGGTCVVGMGERRSSSSSESSVFGVAFIALSLACDGITGGMQNRLKMKSKEMGLTLKPYDFMFWINLYMAAIAAVVAAAHGEVTSGLVFCLRNPIIFDKIWKFTLCSAIGQSFIFYTIIEFDSLVCTTITTSRKVFSVLLSIVLNGHSLSLEGWMGIALACGGILAEMADEKCRHKKAPARPAPSLSLASPSARLT